MRIGGQSTDRAWWPVRGMTQPLGVTYDLTPRWAAAARALAQATGARYLLGINLEADRTRIGQVEADQLVKEIGSRYIDALEIGNEPDLYTLVPWYRQARRPSAPVVQPCRDAGVLPRPRPMARRIRCRSSRGR